jgi:hypothetical protein
MPPQTKAGFPRSPTEPPDLDDDAMRRVDDLLDDMLDASTLPVNADADEPDAEPEEGGQNRPASPAAKRPRRGRPPRK